MIFTLDNGLTIALDRFPHSLASVAFLVGVGSLYEEEKGLTHLLEHMLFRMPNFDVDAAVEALGGENNAFTYRDALVVVIQSLAESSREAVELAYRIYNNRKFENLEKERAVVLSELRQSSEDPAERVGELAVKALFGDSDWGTPVGGLPDVVEGVEMSQLLSHRDKWFTPDNTIVALSGGFGEEAVKRVVELFSRLEGSAPVKKKPSVSTGVSPLVEYREVDGVYYAYAVQVPVENSAETFVNLAAASFHLADGTKSILFHLLRDYGVSYSYHVDFDVVGDVAYLSIVVESAVGLPEARKVVREALKPREPPQYRLNYFRYLWSRREPSARVLTTLEYLNKGGNPAELDDEIWRAVGGGIREFPSVRWVEAVITREALYMG